MSAAVAANDSEEEGSMASTPIGAPGDSGRAQTAPAAAGAVQADKVKTGTVAEARQQQNVRILEASAKVAVKAGDDSQALLLRTAIDRINELLAPEFGEDAIQARMGDDNSPEAVAERILGLSTGFFDAYAKQREGDDPDQVARDFVDLIRGGFEKGFNEAKEILQGLNVFGGEVESGIMKTFDLVMKGYDDFLAARLAPKETGTPAEGAEDAAPATKPADEPQTGGADGR